MQSSADTGNESTVIFKQQSIDSNFMPELMGLENAKDCQEGKFSMIKVIPQARSYGNLPMSGIEKAL